LNIWCYIDKLKFTYINIILSLIKKLPKIDPNFKLVISLFNKMEINYWVCQGTLLGIIRDRSLIPWDPDIDLGIINKSLDILSLKKIMKNNGFNKKKKFFKNDNLITYQKKGGRDIDINFYKYHNKNKSVITEWYVPKSFLMKFIEALSLAKKYDGKGKILIRCLSFLEKFSKSLKMSLIKKNFFYKKAGYSHPSKFIKRFKVIKFYELDINVPFFYLEYLKYTYGNDWRKPKKNYSWFKDSPSTITTTNN
jgi:hypothetical protein